MHYKVYESVYMHGLNLTAGLEVLLTEVSLFTNSVFYNMSVRFIIFQ